MPTDRMTEQSGEMQTAFGFAYRRAGPADAERALVVLHGSGADEGQVLPLAARIDPAAAIVAVRGRIDQNGERRWFRKYTPTTFDQRSIRAEARAFAAFVDGLGRADALNLGRTVFVGYSNGGNLLHSTMLLHPGRITRAILMRCMPVLRRPPKADLAGCRVLLVGGESDLTYGAYSPQLADLLRGAGATVEPSTVACGHEIGDRDVALARRWLAGQAAIG